MQDEGESFSIRDLAMPFRRHSRCGCLFRFTLNLLSPSSSPYIKINEKGRGRGVNSKGREELVVVILRGPRELLRLEATIQRLSTMDCLISKVEVILLVYILVMQLLCTFELRGCALSVRFTRQYLVAAIGETVNLRHCLLLSTDNRYCRLDLPSNQSRRIRYRSRAALWGSMWCLGCDKLGG